MEDQIIVWEMPDGTVRYATCPAGSKKPGETTQQWLSRQFKKTVRDNHPGAKRILKPLMPDGQPIFPGAKKLYYGCWRHKGKGKIQVDMPLARAQRMAEIRAERNSRLDDSDRDHVRFSEIGTAKQKTAISTYRQALRDLPKSVDLKSITTPEKLEAFEPEWPKSSHKGKKG